MAEKGESRLDAWLEKHQIGGTGPREWIALEFNNSTENQAHTVYDPSNIDGAIVAAWCTNAPPPEC